MAGRMTSSPTGTAATLPRTEACRSWRTGQVAMRQDSRQTGVSMRSPSRPSSAGTNVNVAVTATRTTRTAPVPRLRKMVLGSNSIPDRARATVMPEKRTALLALAPAAVPRARTEGLTAHARSLELRLAVAEDY